MSREPRLEHLHGGLRLIDPVEVERARRELLGETGRGKFLSRLCHGIAPHPAYASALRRGQRSADAMLERLRKLGAPAACYVIASDHPALDDTFLDLESLLSTELYRCHHGTIVSCIPGRLALYRTAWPHQHLVVHRPG